jgi:hypothetical protein
MYTRLRPLILAPLLLLAACKGTVSSRPTAPILNPTYTGIFANHPYKADQIKRYGPYTLLEVFKLDSAITDSVTIAFDSTARLRISYTANGTPHEHLFAGVFTKEGEYKFIFENKKKEIPPILPVLYSQYHIHHIRLSLTPEGNLLLRNRWKQGGNIFILGGGDAGCRRYYFSKPS